MPLSPFCLPLHLGAGESRASVFACGFSKARTRVVRVAEYVEYSGPKALLTLTRVAILMCDPTTHTHPSSKQVELVTTHEYSEYSLSGGNRLFSRRRLRLSAGSCALHNYMVRPSYPTHARRRRGLRGKRRCNKWRHSAPWQASWSSRAVRGDNKVPVSGVCFHSEYVCIHVYSV